jgi:hypothetical protein
MVDYDNDRLRPPVPETALRTNLKGVFTLGPPPAGFDPSTASNALLRKYGLPQRPNPDRNPLAWRAWQQAVSRPLGELIHPVFEPSPWQRAAKPDPVSVWNNASTWAGAVLDGQWQSVWGAWTIPTVTVPANPGSQSLFACSAWVGIDASPDTLQVGTTQQITSAGATKYQPWFEWFLQEANMENSPTQQIVPGLTVAANDAVLVQLVYVPMYNQGTYIFTDITSGKWTSFFIPNVGGATFTGNTIEWIVEAPTVQLTSSSSPMVAPLPQFGSVTFTDCGGCSSDKLTQGDPYQGYPVEIFDANGNPLTNVSAAPGTVTVTQLG